MSNAKLKYVFYYDESFHDRKIRESKNEFGKMNIDSEGQSYFFVSSLIGFRTKNEFNFLKKYKRFEIDAKQILDLDRAIELKGTRINIKNFSYGLASFDQRTLKVYEMFFSLFDEDIYYQISIMNKLELVVNKLLRNSYFRVNVDIEALIYSLVKFLNRHKTKRLIQVFFDEHSSQRLVYDTINDLMEKVVNKIEGIENQKKYIQTIRNMQEILKKDYINYNVSTEVDWDYSITIEFFVQFLLNESISLNNVALFIDSELNTFLAARKKDFFSVDSIDSKNSIEVRAADLLANFFGRLIKSIEIEYNKKMKDIEKDAAYQRIILDDKWFDVNIEQFQLYNKISSIIFKNRNVFTVQTGNYPGYVSILFSLINYIGDSYKSFEDYKIFTIDQHKERFNVKSICVEKVFFEKNFKSSDKNSK